MSKYMNPNKKTGIMCGLGKVAQLRRNSIHVGRTIPKTERSEKEAQQSTSFSLISRYTWGSRETSSTLLPRLSAGSLVAGGTSRTRWPRAVATISRWNLVEHHVNSTHLTCKREEKKSVWMEYIYSSSNNYKIPLCLTKVFLTVHKLFTNLSGNGAHHALGCKVSLENKDMFLLF